MPLFCVACVQRRFHIVAVICLNGQVIRVRELASFSIFLNLELLFCKIFDSKGSVFLVCLNSIRTRVVQ